MHPAHTLHTLRGRVEPWDTPARSISTASFLCQRLWMSTCFANNRDLHSFWQHDVLDNMIFSFEFNMFSFGLFHQSNILLDNSSDHRWECQHGSWQQWTFQPKPFCFNSVWPSTSFLPTNKNYGSQHHGNTTNSCQVNSSRWVPPPLWRHRNNRASWNQLQNGWMVPTRTGNKRLPTRSTMVLCSWQRASPGRSTTASSTRRLEKYHQQLLVGMSGNSPTFSSATASMMLAVRWHTICPNSIRQQATQHIGFCWWSQWQHQPLGAWLWTWEPTHSIVLAVIKCFNYLDN